MIVITSCVLDTLKQCLEKADLDSEYGYGRQEIMKVNDIRDYVWTTYEREVKVNLIVLSKEGEDYETKYLAGFYVEELGTEMTAEIATNLIEKYEEKLREESMKNWKDWQIHCDPRQDLVI